MFFAGERIGAVNLNPSTINFQSAFGRTRFQIFIYLSLKQTPYINR
jgi:hypothetical protein